MNQSFKASVDEIRSKAKIARLLGTVSGSAEFHLLSAHYPRLQDLDASLMQDMEDADLRKSLVQLRARCDKLCKIDLRGLGSSVGLLTRYFLKVLWKQLIAAKGLKIDEPKVTGASVTLSFNGPAVGSSVLLAVAN